MVLSSFSGVATIFLLQSVLDLLAKLNCFMQRKATDFSKLPVILESIVSELNQLKRDDAEWCSQVTACVNKLANEQGINLTRSSTRSGSGSATTVSEYCTSVAIHYIDALVSNIKGRFSEGAVNSLSHHPSLIQLHFQLKNRLFPSMARKKYKRWSTSMEKKQQ